VLAVVQDGIDDNCVINSKLMNAKPSPKPIAVRVLLIEETEHDYATTYALLEQAYGGAHNTQWVNSIEKALAALTSDVFDVCVFGLDVSEHSLLERLPASVFPIDFSLRIPLNINTIVRQTQMVPPIITLTHGAAAMPGVNTGAPGVVDSLSKNGLEAAVLARVIHYAMRQRQSDIALYESEAKRESVLATMREGVVICDERGIIDSINALVETLFDVSKQQILSKRFFDFIADQYHPKIKHYFERCTASLPHHAGVFYDEVEGVCQTRPPYPMSLRITEMQLAERRLFVCVIRDISLDKQQAEELQLTATAFGTHTAILITEANGTILRINPAFTEITGYKAHEVIGGNPKILQSGHHDQGFYDDMWQQISRDGKWEGEIWNKRKNGQIYPEWQTITAVKNSQGETTHYVATFLDITERKHAQALIEHQAYYDSLTNLPNRRMALERLNQELSAARRHHIFGALLFLDVDHFKALNDSMGHAAGDALLQQMAKRLSSNVRTEDTVARLGGDEFVVVLPNLDKRKKLSTETATTIAEKIRAAVAQPYQLGDGTYSFTPSIGVTLFPFEGDSADDVLKHADTAMYRAKNNGRNAICFYQPKMQEQADNRLRLEEELRGAVEKDELSLLYQPQYNAVGNPIGVEALLRWDNAVCSDMEPSEVIALAEEINVILPIGSWVLNTAVAQYVEWREAGGIDSDTFLAINISPKQIQTIDFVSQVKALLLKHRFPPVNLKLELTENIMLYKINSIISNMNELHKLGVSFTMDDFGTRFSSLSYLKRLPFDQIKIDQTFIDDLTTENNDAAIVETIIAMAEHLKLTVIAEGVETKAELVFLQEKGCNTYQGFYFSYPLKASEVVAKFKEKND